MKLLRFLLNLSPFALVTLAGCVTPPAASEFVWQTEAEKAADAANGTDVAGTDDTTPTDDVIAPDADARDDADGSDAAGEVTADADATAEVDSAVDGDAALDGDAEDVDAAGDVDSAGEVDTAGEIDAATDAVGTDAQTGDADAENPDTPDADADAETDVAPDVLVPKCVQTSDCDDSNPCTDDGCVPETGCTHVANTASCSDGNACTENDSCADTACQPGSAKSCDDSVQCTENKCDPASGCIFPVSTDGTACDDNNACTTVDACSGSSCLGSGAPNCDDGTVCTTDSCDTASGCTHVPADGLTCSDGNACTTGDKCSGGTCTSTGTLACNDSNVCTTDACDPPTGCTHTNNTVACTDNDNCTENDTCSEGTCKSGTAVVCDDKNPCTIDSCNSIKGCITSNQIDGLACDDGTLCTDSDGCKSGVCTGKANLWQNVRGGGKFDEVSAIVPMSDGGVTYAIRTQSGSKGGWDTFIYRTDKYGADLWNIELGGDKDDLLFAGVESGKDVVFVGKTSSKGTGGTAIWFVRLSGNTGAVVADVPIGGTQNEDIGQGIVATSSGFAIVGTNSSKVGNLNGWLVFTDGLGAVTSDFTYGKADKDDQLYGITALADGYLLTGSSSIACCGNVQGFAVRTDLSGGVVFTKFYNVSNGYDHLAAGSQVGQELVLVGTTNAYPLTGNSWILHTDLSGNLRSSVGVGGNNYLNSFQMQPDGILFGGWNFVDSGSALVFRTDFQGNLQSTVNFRVKNQFSTVAVVAATSTGILAGGHTEDQNGYDGSDSFFQRLDAFANVSCDASKDCAIKTFAQCGDSNSCTVNSCAAGSCTSATLSDASLCDDGSLCTMKDACVSGACTGGVPTDYDGDGKSPSACGGGSDCDDGNALVYKGAKELCDDGQTDNDCDGSKSDSSCTCPLYWAPANSDNGKVCGAMAPIWGTRAESTDIHLHDEGDGTFVDFKSLLRWQSVPTTGVNGPTARSGCLTLTLGGYSDWRLPTTFELYSLVAQLKKPTFPGVGTWPTNDPLDIIYWNDFQNSVETNAVNMSIGWISANYPVNNLATARCVRGGIVPFSVDNRFVDAGTDSKKDTFTGLTWETNPPAVLYNWNDAITHCLKLTTDGKIWRMPHISELYGFGVPDGGLPTLYSGFGGKSEEYWTVTKFASDRAWTVNFNFDWPYNSLMTDLHYVRCVSGASACSPIVPDCYAGDPCTLSYCDPFTDTCIGDGKNDNETCDDSNVCTMKEFCTSRICGGGVLTDIDGDGYAPKACGGLDCDDAYSLRRPSGLEYCDGGTIDDNCNGQIDENCICGAGYDKVGLNSGDVCAANTAIWGDLAPLPVQILQDAGDSTLVNIVSKMEVQKDDSGSDMTYAQAVTYCKGLTRNMHTDWRLPSPVELMSLVSYGNFNPALTDSFTTNSGHFWTEKTTKLDPAQIWTVAFDFGALTWDDTTATMRARCVRGAYAPVDVSKRFVVDTTAGSVHDLYTDRFWEQTPPTPGQTWQGAVDRCAALNLNGVTGWRLPSVNELRVLLNFDAIIPAMDITAFPGQVVDWYWTATQQQNSTTDAWYVDIYLGHSDHASTTKVAMSRCVRP